MRATPPEVLLTSVDLPQRWRENLSGYRVIDTRREDWASDVPHAVGWITSRDVDVSATSLGLMPKLRVISQFGVGYDNIDIGAAVRRGIVVCHTRDVLDAAVAELVVCLLIAMRREVFAARSYVEAGSWALDRAPLAHDATGCTLGIVGYGRIGHKVAHMARSIGIRVIHGRPDRPADPADPESRAWGDLFEQSDVISVHTPLSAETRGLIGANELSRLRPSAYLINTARGGVVDEVALAHAIQRRALAGAALDVATQEPIGLGHPLLDLPQVVLLPHIGSSTVETRGRMLDLCLRNLVAALEGGHALLVPECEKSALNSGEDLAHDLNGNDNAKGTA